MELIMEYITNFLNGRDEIVPLSHVLLPAIAGFVISMLLTPVYTKLAFKYKWWKQARTHDVTGKKSPIVNSLFADKHKRNIPTMGGMILIAAVAVVTLFLNLDRNQTWLPLLTLVGAGLIGLLDDYINIRGSANLAGGLRSKLKFNLILGIAIIGALYFHFRLGYDLIHIPAVGDFSIGWLYIPLFIAVVVSTANAVNITDGLDGLAGGLLSTAFAAFGVIAYFQGNYGIAGFCATIVGVMLAYTWFSIYPMRFLMGDSGSFAIGTTLGVIAMLTNSVAVLPIIGAVFVAEAGSSALQILSKKIRKKKIFLAAPIHHHFQAKGWPETKVTMRFWVIGQVCGAVGLIIGLLGNKAL